MYDVRVAVYGDFFFFKHNTAYEMRISDWSSDVCSSDLVDDGAAALRYHERQCMLAHQHRPACVHAHDLVPKFDRHGENITIIYIAMIGGIIVKDIQPSEEVARKRHQGLGMAFIGNVDRTRRHFQTFILLRRGPVMIDRNSTRLN